MNMIWFLVTHGFELDHIKNEEFKELQSEVRRRMPHSSAEAST
jgi:hypothetical protein